jgi:hypothetical protein
LDPEEQADKLQKTVSPSTQQHDVRCMRKLDHGRGEIATVTGSAMPS